MVVEVHGGVAREDGGEFVERGVRVRVMVSGFETWSLGNGKHTHSSALHRFLVWEHIVSEEQCDTDAE